MRMGVNVPNFGPGTDPGVLRGWAQTVEGLGFDLLMLSDHVTIQPDVAAQYPAPFYEPFTALAWLAGITDRIWLGTTVLVVPYRHPLLIARMAANLDEISGGRFVLGAGVGWARQEFAALGVPFEQRGRLTDEHLRAVRSAWADTADYGTGRIPIWVGGNSDLGLRRAVRLGDAWHPLRFTPDRWDEVPARMARIAAAEQRPVPALAPRIALQLTEVPISDPDRLLGAGSLDQIVDDLRHLDRLDAETVVLEPFNGDPEETRHPERSWRALAAVVDAWAEAGPSRTPRIATDEGSTP